MGCQLTIDKHLTNLPQWLQVSQKLQDVQFSSPISSHLGIYKIIQNPQSSTYNIIPILIDIQTIESLFSKNQCYVIYAIRSIDDRQEEFQIYSTRIAITLQNIRNHICRNTYEVPISRGSLQQHQFRVYSYFGKKAKPKAKLVATSYALKLAQFINSTKKLAILSNGGVLRNKKLQKGSTLSFDFNNQQNDANLGIINLNNENSSIDILNFFSPQKKVKQLQILSLKSQRSLPMIQKMKKIQNVQRVQRIQRLQRGQVQKQKATPQAITQKSMFPIQQIKQKKPALQKMNLKLDFSKPLASKSSSIHQNLNQNSLNSIQNIAFTNRSQQRRGKRQKCEEECSQIIEGLYVSGEKVARNYQTLKKHNIKYIVNCAGDYCQNWFQNTQINYLTFFLKDSQNQNIECLFYRVIQFIQKAHKSKQNVLIHCIQGISRSITFTIAYIIFKYGYDYKKSQCFIKQKRSIACPNNGFMVQLIQFHKRLYDQYDSLLHPRVFMISAHSKDTPHLLAARMLKVGLFQDRKYVGLDSRALYVVHSREVVYVWVGSKCEEQRLEKYWNFANEFVKKLQKYERAPVKVKAVSQGAQEKQFLALWNLTQTPKLYQNQQYTRLFIEGQPSRPGQQRQFYQQIQQQQSIPNKLFIYPDFQSCLGVFSHQDLNGMCILAKIQDQNKLILYIWKEKGFDGDQEFIAKVVDRHFTQIDQDNIQIREEDIDNPTEMFLSCFTN